MEPSFSKDARPLSSDQLEDIFEWDITNWSRCSHGFDEHFKSATGKKGLELGGRRGGMALWMALRGYDVICSDLNSPQEKAEGLHKKYSLTEHIRYEAINAVDIPYKEHFDLIMFKSILGGVSRDGENQRKGECIEQIHAALKPGGKLLFAENLAASGMHRYLRKKFVNWGEKWNYLEFSEIDNLFERFSKVEYRTVGFFGAFGRTESQRRILGYIDKLIDRIIPSSKRYIVFVVATR